MHPIQAKLLLLSKERNLADMSLREMAKAIGESASPQKIKHHFVQLEKKGFFKVERSGGVIKRAPEWAKTAMQKGRHLFSIPVIGIANCGPAEVFADTNFQGFLKVSDKLIGRSNVRGLYAIKTDGSSMNMAEIKGKKIDDGDYVIVDSNQQNPSNKDVVLAIIDDKATIKRYIEDKENDQIVLMADSTYDYEPIYLHQSDDFSINGKIIDIIKKPKIN